MLFVVDGYNVIKSEHGRIFEGKTLEQQRNLLLELIARNRPHGSPNNKVTVVFDGTYEMAMQGGQAQPAAGGVAVVYSGGETADEKIEEIVLGLANPAEVTVVTDDRGIRRRLGGSGARHMDVARFFSKLVKEDA